MVSDPDTTEQYGEVYGFNLIYSGSHCARIESGPFSRTRISAGIGQDGFSWTLSGKDGEESRFDTPEAVLTWSDRGFRGCSVHMHRFVKDHIVRGKWAKKERPVVINNWEATYFKFKSHTLLRLAKEAKDLGCELFVLDDGWFGRRDTDESSLGDYTVNTKKLRGGLAGFGEELKKLGMDFGLWMEPEMISPDSDLYRAHPDWAVQVPGMEPSKGRHQLVLDLCRKDVQDYIIAQVCGILDSAPITYIKWDMNRTITDQFSRGESMSAPDGKAEQGRFFHAWTLGLYRVMNQIVRTHPDILFEGCASGGNRFDLGILCYMPQIWTSDDTDAWERMLIQTGTSYGYPQSVMSCHVSASPNHQTLRTTPLESRFDVAAMGILGYELDLAVLPSAEKKVIRAQIEWYKAHRSLLQFGTFYRLASPFKEPERCIWMVVSPDRAEAVVMEGTGRLVPNSETPPVRLAGLDPDSLYKVTVRPQLIDIRTFGSLLNMVSPVKLNTSGLAVHIVSDHYRMTSETEQFLAYGDLLMHAGIRPKAGFTGCGYGEEVRMMPDYGARIWELKKKE